MDDMRRLLADLQADDNLREWITKSPNEASANVVLADLGYNVSVAELRRSLENGSYGTNCGRELSLPGEGVNHGSQPESTTE